MTLTENDDVLVPPNTLNNECTAVDEILLNREQKLVFGCCKTYFRVN
jgi:hypothetical protein